MRVFFRLHKNILFFLALTVFMGLSVCQAAPHESMGINDPFEPANRLIYRFNRLVDKTLVVPAVRVYRFVLPQPVRKGIRNVLNNLKEPVNFVNCVLQGDIDCSFTTFWRFAINTTFGIGGIADIAAIEKLYYRQEDFGQTLGHYGFGSGPYLMLPILGPSSIRDGIGLTVDSFSDPLYYTLNSEMITTRSALSGIDTRESLMGPIQNIDETSLDPYASFRSLYYQKRLDLIKNGL